MKKGYKTGIMIPGKSRIKAPGLFRCIYRKGSVKRFGGIDVLGRDPPPRGMAAGKEATAMPRRRSENLNVYQDQFVRMEANGYSTREIIRKMYGIEEETDPNGYHAKEAMFTRWRKHPKYFETWKDEIGRSAMKMMTKGLRKINEQINGEDRWLANKAANDCVNFARSRVFAEEDKTYTVQIQGMPDLGSPEDNE